MSAPSVKTGDYRATIGEVCGEWLAEHVMHQTGDAVVGAGSGLQILFQVSKARSARSEVEAGRPTIRLL